MTLYLTYELMEFLKYIDVVAEGLRRDGKDTTTHGGHQ